MASIGAKLRWKEGKLLFPSNYWKSPSKRRLPKLLIEDRANMVGILIYIEEPWVVFQETDIPVDKINTNEALKLEFYARRYNLLPEKIKRQDSYRWMNKQNNALLLFGKDNHYFIKAHKRP